MKPNSQSTPQHCIQNSVSDNYCLFRAAIQSLILSTDDHHKTGDALNVGTGASNLPHLLQLIRYADIEEGQIDFPLMTYGPIIEAFFNETFPEKSPYRLIVTTTHDIKDSFAYPINNFYDTVPRSNLLLYLIDNHYYCVSRPTRFFNSRYVCYSCNTTFMNLRSHRKDCPDRCRYCYQWNSIVPCPDEDGVKINCQECNKVFKNKKCYDYHLKTNCRHFKTCSQCSKRYMRKKGHKCYMITCKKCSKTHDKRKQCFIDYLNSIVEYANPPDTSFSEKTR